MVITMDYAEASGAGVKNTLGKMTLEPKLIKYLKDNQEVWKTFGKMNSHLYRGKLMAAMERKQLNAEAKLMVWAMASIIKSHSRIIEAMENTPDTEKFTGTDVWTHTLDFFKTECTQYVSEHKKTKKFPVVNIPTTMPGLDILLFCLTTPDAERTMETLSHRPTFTQMALAPAVQTTAKAGYEYFWTKIVKGTRNKDKVEAPAMNESFYNTSAEDTYRLLNADKAGVLSEVVPKHSSGLYNKEEIEAYLRSFDAKSRS